MKASRDIIVHSQGVANKKYIEKSRKMARAKEEELLVIDEAYFKSIVSTVKQLYDDFYKTVLSGYGDDDNVARVLKAKRFS
jgi:hypothetical protein